MADTRYRSSVLLVLNHISPFWGKRFWFDRAKPFHFRWADTANPRYEIRNEG